jgi:hypothetical protein
MTSELLPEPLRRIRALHLVAGEPEIPVSVDRAPRHVTTEMAHAVHGLWMGLIPLPAGVTVRFQPRDFRVFGRLARAQCKRSSEALSERPGRSLGQCSGGPDPETTWAEIDAGGDGSAWPALAGAQQGGEQ